MSDNLLLAPWSGPLGGLPPLDRVELHHFEPAIHAAMESKLDSAHAIRSSDQPPSFENTLEALEQMGAQLEKVLAVYDLWSSNFSTPQLREIEKRVEPELARVRDSILQDSALFERVQQVAELPTLNSEQQRLVEVWIRRFRRSGAHLDTDGRARVAAINQRLATLYTEFSARLLGDEEAGVTWLDASQLGGLSDAFTASARSAAIDRGRPDAWAVTNSRSSAEPFLEASTERSLREQVWRTFYSRGNNGDHNSTKPLIPEILSLRLERAQLLGYPTHAHLVLEPTMARTPEAAMELMERVWTGASARFAHEITELQALADSRGDGIAIEAWDVRFYAALYRKQRYELDPAELLQHFQLDRLVDGMFWTATKRFGWTFHPTEIPLPHPEFSAWEVRNSDGTPRGLFLLDPWARKGKRSGAWMTAYRVQQGLAGDLPIVSNNCNFRKPPPGEPTLLTLDEAKTLFHEFGHGLHGLASAVTYPSLAGTAVPRDFVEFPSQLNEHWLTTPSLLHQFALHRSTQLPPSDELLEKMTQAANADSGFRTMEFLASAVMDMEMHLCTDPIEPSSFEEQTLSRWGLLPQVVMRHRTTQFAHIFSGESYSAGYYSYLWADVLVADAAELNETAPR